MNRGTHLVARHRAARRRRARLRRVQRRRRPRPRNRPARRRSWSPSPPVAATEQPIARFIRATGTLMAEEQADVAAETAGRVVATPVERGTPVAAGRRADPPVADRDRRAAEGSRGQRRADRGAARHHRRHRRSTSTPCPKCRTRRPALELAQSEFDAHQVAARPARRLAVGIRPAPHAGGSRAPAVRGRRRTARRSSTRRCRRRARASRSRRRRSPTPSSARRSPASSRERLVSIGDYVTKGMKVAIVVRVDPLRVAADRARAVRVGDRASASR